MVKNSLDDIFNDSEEVISVIEQQIDDSGSEHTEGQPSGAKGMNMEENIENSTSKSSTLSFLEDSEEQEEIEKASDVPYNPQEFPRTTAQLIKIRDVENEFENLVRECQLTLSQLPLNGVDDYKNIKEELSHSYIDFEESPTPFDLSKQLAMVQVMKDRMLQVYADAHLNYTIRHRIMSTLTDAYSVVSQAKTADKRKGEASIALSRFSIEMAEAEVFYDYCKKIIENLESQYRVISRRIVCMEMQISLGEMSTSEAFNDAERERGRLIKDIINEKKKLNSEPRSVDW
jgi:hypothetical protein